jgi:kumamolisin
MMAQQVALPGSKRAGKSDAKRVRDVDQNSHIEVTITLRAPDSPAADQLTGVSMSPEEFAAKFGARREDADKVASVLEGYGLKVEDISLPTCSMRVSGTAAQIEAAFRPNLAIYHSAEQGEFRGREGDIKIPAELEGIVEGVFGLDERRVARRKSTALNAAAAAALAPRTPADLEQRYQFPPGDGQGQQIAIAEFEGGYFPDDLTAYCQKFSRPVPTVNTISVGIPVLTLDQIRNLPPQQRNAELGATIEVMMDVQIVAGLCPAANISVYFAPFTQKGWIDLLNQVIQARPVTLSVSWGAPEDSSDWSTAARNAINARMAAAATLGITVCVASGDDGSGDELSDGRAHVDFPTSSPFVLSVGGTMISGTSHHTEKVWWEAPGRRTSNGGGSTGGGVSVFFNRPAWQNVTIQSLNSNSIDGRVVPDIAALAGPPLYDLIFVGRDFPNGGTSASTPLWAALIARINAKLPANKQQRFLTPLLYQPGSDGHPRGQSTCHDITVGENTSHPQPGVGYKAKKGYDAVTGWGTPNGAALLTALSS